MVIFRFIGWLFLLAGVAAFGFDLWRWLIDGATFRLIEIGALWNQIDSTSLQLAQAGIQRHVWPFLWDAIVTILLWPAAPAFAIFGIVLMILFRRRGRRYA